MRREASTAADLERFLPREELDQLIQVLIKLGYQVVGPTLDQGAIVYSEIRSADELPRGWIDSQGPGRYRLEQSGDEYFGYTVGPHSWKRYLFPSHEIVAEAQRTADGWHMRSPEYDPPRYAFLGVRACEIAAIEVQDRTFIGASCSDPFYKARRELALIIAVNCTRAAETCFCTSMGSGPRVRRGFDVALTETPEGFVIECASDAGAAVLKELPIRDVAPCELESAEAARQRAVDQITKRLDTDDIRNLLLSNLDHPRWDEVATRCLSCTNCTMVCPTCFCSSVTEVSELNGDHVQRERKWDSCFNVDFSYMNGGVVRDAIRPRYRQWLTHKLASWWDQFGTSGCVGCGRCITWCPVGIDLTEEVAAIRGSRSA